MADDDFYMLGQLIGGYLNQDMEMWAESVPEAVAKFARESDAATHETLKREIDLFLARHHNDLEGAFQALYGFDFTPDLIGQTVPSFFDMTRAILDEPQSWPRFDAVPQGSSSEGA